MLSIIGALSAVVASQVAVQSHWTSPPANLVDFVGQVVDGDKAICSGFYASSDSFFTPASCIRKVDDQLLVRFTKDNPSQNHTKQVGALQKIEPEGRWYSREPFFDKAILTGDFTSSPTTFDFKFNTYDHSSPQKAFTVVRFNASVPEAREFTKVEDRECKKAFTHSEGPIEMFCVQESEGKGQQELSMTDKGAPAFVKDAESTPTIAGIFTRIEEYRGNKYYFFTEVAVFFRDDEE